MRTPFAAHLCAEMPEQWADGFEQASAWVAVAHPGEAARMSRTIRTSSGVPWPVTAARLGVPPDAWHEGWALGVYGEAGP